MVLKEGSRTFELKFSLEFCFRCLSEILTCKDEFCFCQNPSLEVNVPVWLGHVLVPCPNIHLPASICYSLGGLLRECYKNWSRLITLLSLPLSFCLYAKFITVQPDNFHSTSFPKLPSLCQENTVLYSMWGYLKPALLEELVFCVTPHHCLLFP